MSSDPPGLVSPLARLQPRLVLGATLAFVAGVVLTPLGAWKALALEGIVLAFLVGVSGLPPSWLLRRFLGIAVLLVFLALMVAPSHPAREALGPVLVVVAMVARNGLAVLALMTLAGVLPVPRLLSGLRGLGLPPVLIETLYFMQRYVHVLQDELARMLRARRSRSFRRHRRGRDWAGLGGLLGHLFLRALERGERVHSAMLARGWDGTLRTLDADAT